MLENIKSHQHEKIVTLRWVWDYFSCLIPIALSVYLCKTFSMWLYPLLVFVIIQRQISFIAIGHEAMHGLISKNKGLNDFIGRFLCHFPNFISFSRYKSLHLLHHRYTGSENDPDLHLYGYYPIGFKSWLLFLIKKIINLSFLGDFLLYFTEIPSQLNKWLKLPLKPSPLLIKSDFLSFCFFWLSIGIFIFYFNIEKDFFIFWIIPLFLSLPFVYLQNALEHGSVDKNNIHPTRSITSSLGLTKFFLPLNLHYHLEHHLNPSVPHYNLKNYSNHLKDLKVLDNHNDFQISLFTTFKKVFHE